MNLMNVEGKKKWHFFPLHYYVANVRIQFLRRKSKEQQKKSRSLFRERFCKAEKNFKWLLHWLSFVLSLFFFSSRFWVFLAMILWTVAQVLGRLFFAYQVQFSQQIFLPINSLISPLKWGNLLYFIVLFSHLNHFFICFFVKGDFFSLSPVENEKINLSIPISTKMLLFFRCLLESIWEEESNENGND